MDTLLLCPVVVTSLITHIRSKFERAHSSLTAKEQIAGWKQSILGTVKNVVQLVTHWHASTDRVY